MRAPSPRWIALLLAVVFAAPPLRAEFVFTSFAALRSAPHQPWTTTLDDGKTRAKAQGKRVFVYFTGSDWCAHCIALEKDVLSTERFLDYADKELVLVKLDFPMRRAQDPGEKARNEALLESYGVKGFPTVVVLRSDGKEAGRFVPDHAAGLQGFMSALEKAK